jgi:hypothetical protein
MNQGFWRGLGGGGDPFWLHRGVLNFKGSCSIPKHCNISDSSEHKIPPNFDTLSDPCMGRSASKGKSMSTVSTVHVPNANKLPYIYRVIATAFHNYAKESEKLFVSLYSWYYVPASVHKVLIHGSVIVSAALLRYRSAVGGNPGTRT